MYIFTACIVNTVLLVSTPTYEDRIIGTDGEQEQRPTDRKTDAQNWKRQLPTSGMCNGALIKKKIKISSYIRKFRMERLQSRIWLTASSYMGKYFRISSYIRKPFLIHDFTTYPLLIPLYMRKIFFSILSVCSIQRTWFLYLQSASIYLQQDNS